MASIVSIVRESESFDVVGVLLNKKAFVQKKKKKLKNKHLDPPGSSLNRMHEQKNGCISVHKLAGRSKP